MKLTLNISEWDVMVKSWNKKEKNTVIWKLSTLITKKSWMALWKNLCEIVKISLIFVYHSIMSKKKFYKIKENFRKKFLIGK